MTLRMILGIVLAVLFWGCSDEPTAPESPYLSPSSPENVVTNLQIAYRLRDIDAYSGLLAPEFVFYFQPVDAQEIETEFWTRDQDTTGTGALFGTPLISQITINLTHGNAIPTNEVDFPPGTMTIRINQTQLEVDQTDGITWLAQDIQDMFFRRGNEGAGEDTTLWFLIEWRDIPPANLVRSPSGGEQETTWGNVKTLYK